MVVRELYKLWDYGNMVKAVVISWVMKVLCKLPSEYGKSLQVESALAGLEGLYRPSHNVIRLLQGCERNAEAA